MDWNEELKLMEKGEIVSGECLFPSGVDQTLATDLCLKVYKMRKTLLPLIVVESFWIQEKLTEEKDPHFKCEYSFVPAKLSGRACHSVSMTNAVPYTVGKEEKGGTIRLNLSYTFVGEVFTEEEKEMWRCLLFQLLQLYAKGIREYRESREMIYDLTRFLL